MRGALLVFALVLALPFAARAQPAESAGAGGGDDYDIDSRRWNGLATLAALARGLGWEVEQVRRIDWSELGRSDLLFVLYPTRSLEPGHLSMFIRGGGHVLIGDDFGRSTAALADLGILREEGRGVAAERFHDNLPYAPIARPEMSSHPLAAGVTELTGNHPAVLPEVAGPDVIFSFGPGEAAVAAGSLGSGRFVVMSDPSMLINRMLEFQGNLDFAINSLRYLGRPGETDRLVILTRDFSLRGEPTGALDDTGGGALSRVLHDFNSWVDQDVNRYLLTDAGVRLVSVIAGLVVTLLCVLALPLGRRASLDGRWTRAGAESGRAYDFETVVRAFDGERPGASFLLPAAVIRDTVNAKLARVLEVREPLYSMRRAELLSALEAARGSEAKAALEPLLPLLRALPTRSQATSPYESAMLPRREFHRLREGAARLYRSLGEG